MSRRRWCCCCCRWFFGGLGGGSWGWRCCCRRRRCGGGGCCSGCGGEENWILAVNCNVALKNRRKKRRERGGKNARLMCVKNTSKGINVRNTYFRERDQGPRSGLKVFFFFSLKF